MTLALTDATRYVRQVACQGHFAPTRVVFMMFQNSTALRCLPACLPTDDQKSEQYHRHGAFTGLMRRVLVLVDAVFDDDNTYYPNLYLMASKEGK